jgi:hypothetical protein
VKPWTRAGHPDQRDELIETLTRRVDALEESVQENRRLNQRLVDVIDVVTEVLVPAADRDDARMQAALQRLNETLDGDAPTAG